MQKFRIFAFGSNLHQEDLERWFRQHRLPPPRIEQLRPAWCPDHEPVYHLYAAGRAGGVLDIRAADRGQLAPGGLFETDSETLRGLDRKEGTPFVYECRTVTVLTADGEEHEALTYQVHPRRQQARHIAPDGYYRTIVKLGLEELGHDATPMEQAAEGQPVTPSVTGLFVYGTLKTGECREHALAAYADGARQPAQIPGRLVHLGSYPGLLPPTRPEEQVHGEYVPLSQLPAALTVADEIEDFVAYGFPGNLYARRLVTTRLADGATRLAWTYYYLGDTSQALRVDGGRWSADSYGT